RRSTGAPMPGLSRVHTSCRSMQRGTIRRSNSRTRSPTASAHSSADDSARTPTSSSRAYAGRKYMDVWWQCEIPYPFVPQDVLAKTDSVRGSLPNKWCDPKGAADLYEEVLDE